MKEVVLIMFGIWVIQISYLNWAEAVRQVMLGKAHL
jgi:hypothetical protein